MMQVQKRGKSIAMSSEELDEFLGAEHTVRIATVDRKGRPHVMPLWFVWDGEALWLNSVVRSSRWVHLETNPEAAAVVDTGDDFYTLRGVQLRGPVEVVGEVPRGSGPNAQLQPIESMYVAKYRDGASFEPDGIHAWLRLVPRIAISWDHRKIRR